MKRIAIATAMSVMFGSAAAQTAAPATGTGESAAARLNAAQVDKDQLQRRLESVSKLLETSSAARQIDSSGDPRALETREKARAIYRDARAAFDAGELQKANQILPQATILMFEAVRYAAPDEVVAKKLEADFEARNESVKALLAAYKRVAAEKGSKGAGETASSIEKSISEAGKLAAAGKFREGRAELDRAYLVTKAAISSLRSGDTLVRSLNFATKEEEFHYEVDRNETHQMLIKVLVEEKRATNPYLDKQVQSFLDKARDLRSAADSAAAAKNYEQAIQLLEESTAELVRAIRNAGVYIPG